MIVTQLALSERSESNGANLIGERSYSSAGELAHVTEVKGRQRVMCRWTRVTAMPEGIGLPHSATLRAGSERSRMGQVIDKRRNM